MANDTLSMPKLFQACHEVATVMMAPLHYRDLTRLALAHVGVSSDSVNWRRQVEDVREKLLTAGAHGFGYTGAPYCQAYLREWLPHATILNASQPVLIPANLEASRAAVTEAANRRYTDKTQARLGAIIKGRARGLLIEQQVSRWFADRWPGMFLPPDNKGRWNRPCGHDFKLMVGERCLRVDVAGDKEAKGTYGQPHGSRKQVTDIHVLATIKGNEVAIVGFVPGNEFQDIFTDWASRPISRLAFWLNCNKLGVSHELFVATELKTGGRVNAKTATRRKVYPQTHANL